MAASLPELHDELAATLPASRAQTPLATAGVATHRPGSDTANDAAPIAKLVLPAVDLDTLRLTQSVCDLRFSHCAALAGVDLESVSVRDTAGGSAPAASDPAVLTVSFRTRYAPEQPASASIEIDLDQYPALRIALGAADTDHASASAASLKRQQALTLAVGGLLMEPLFARLGQLQFTDLRLTGIARGRIAQQFDGPFVYLAFSLPPDENTGNSAPRIRYEHVLSLPERAIECIDALVKEAPVAPTFDDLPVPGRIVLGIKPLAIDTLARLQPGDVLLRALFPSFDAQLFEPHQAMRNADDESHPTPDPAAPCAVAVWGTPGLVRLCAAVQFDGTTPVIIKEPYMSEHLEPAFADAGLAIDRADDLIRVGELELPVQFEIDTLAMPLSQLSALGPGYVIEFPVPFDDARLRLVAHGNTIGYGELVTVGDHLGVRIVRMAHNSNGTAPGTSDGSI